MQRSYIDYAMSVIIGRALPDVRDGLKPVHTRILYAMYDGGYRPERGYFKCSRVIGDVMGNYHPHGDSAIYDALVRMAQPWSMRMPLIDSQGNFGSPGNRKSTRLNSSHGYISYAVFCLKKNHILLRRTYPRYYFAASCRHAQSYYLMG